MLFNVGGISSSQQKGLSSNQLGLFLYILPVPVWVLSVYLRLISNSKLCASSVIDWRPVHDVPCFCPLRQLWYAEW